MIEAVAGGREGKSIAARRATILTLNAWLDVVDIDAVVPDRTAQPMLRNSARSGAIYLATVLLWTDSSGQR